MVTWTILQLTNPMNKIMIRMVKTSRGQGLLIQRDLLEMLALASVIIKHPPCKHLQALVASLQRPKHLLIQIKIRMIKVFGLLQNQFQV